MRLIHGLPFAVIASATAWMISESAVAESADPAAEPVVFDCWDCTEEFCPDNYHQVGVVMGSIDPMYDGPTHGCEFGQCGDHPLCFGFAAELLDEVAPAVANRDIARLASFAKAHPDIVRYNAARLSYQVVGCGGGLIANVPVVGP